MIVNEKKTGFGMHSQQQLLLVGVAIAAITGVTTFVSAQVTEWDAFKGFDYAQTENNVQPTIPQSIVADSMLFASEPADISAANMTSVAGTTHYTDIADVEWQIFTSFGSLAELNLAFPNNTTYSINITSGTLAPSSQSFTIGAEALPTAVPYLTGNSFDSLRYLDPANDITLTFESAASANAIQAILEIYHFPEGSDEVHLFSQFLGPNETEFVLPGGTLTAGEVYEVIIGFGNLTDIPADPSGFNVEGVVGFSRATLIEFTAGTLPSAASCPGDADGDGMVNFNDITSVLSNWLSVCP